jgi:hypothetical protein
MIIYICELKDSPAAVQAKSEIDDFHKRAEEADVFLKKQVENLKSDHSRIWKKFFEVAKELGKVPSTASYDDYSVFLGGQDESQLFVKKREEEPGGGFFEFIKNLK